MASDHSTQLTPSQRQVYNRVLAAWQESSAPQLLLNVDGRAGTGKSYIIQKLRETLQEAVVCLAPTGTAAHLIAGQTIHEFCDIIPHEAWGDLGGRRLTKLKERVSGISVVIIDEKSMVSLRLLHGIDRRLRQATAKTTCWFGGLHVVLIGDFSQLPPVKEKPLFTPRESVGDADLCGRLAYERFDANIELQQTMRQAEALEAPFLAALNGLRSYNITVEHWQTLASRCRSVLPPAEQRDFEQTAIHLSFQNDVVHAVNMRRIAWLGRPILSICAKDSHPPMTDSNLPDILHLAIGCRVMLLQNLWTKWGITNGRQGILHDIVWAEGVEQPEKVWPAAVMVDFDSVDPRCPAMIETADGIKVCPIFPCRRRQVDRTAWREQFPLQLCYAMTVHKAQGQTIPRIILDINEREFASGLTYVALSRVRSLQSVMFTRAFDVAALQSNSGGNIAAMRTEDFDRRYPLAATTLSQNIYGST